MSATWIQFTILMCTLIAFALRGEHRITRVETMVKPLWQKFIDGKLSPHG